MRKHISVLSLLLAIMMIVSICTMLLSSCGSTQEKTETEKATEEVIEKASEKATEIATEKKTEKPTEKATEKITEKATEKITEKTTEKTTETMIAGNFKGTLNFTTEMMPSDDFNPNLYGLALLDSAARDYDRIENGPPKASAPATCLKGDTVTFYDFETDKDMDIVLVIEYVAREMTSGNRGISFAIDESDIASQLLTFSGEGNTPRYCMVATIKDMTKGPHTLKIKTVEGFNDTTLKSCDYFKVQILQTK